MTRLLAYATPLAPALAVIGFFVWFANWIPQTRWSPPQKHTIASDTSPAQLAAHGKEIVRQRGCLTCHTLEPGAGVKGHGRGPNLANIGARRSRGVEGGPANLVEYLVQALYEPGAYLVEGYANIMPPSTGVPAKLTYEEVVAVVNYLQSLGGKPSVRVGNIPRPSGAPGAVAAASAKQQEAKDPMALLNSFACLGCHSMEAGKASVGPSLAASEVKKAAAERKQSVEAYLIEAIVDPKAYERKGFASGVMPQDYGSKLTAAQLKLMVDHLAGGKP
ncbi:MAG: c-type cytochrome [Betaproteobacteria bacterium]|nr:c-type cytochrome [Betaproteobacteria bacterium]